MNHTIHFTPSSARVQHESSWKTLVIRGHLKHSRFFPSLFISCFNNQWNTYTYTQPLTMCACHDTVSKNYSGYIVWILLNKKGVFIYHCFRRYAIHHFLPPPSTSTSSSPGAFPDPDDRMVVVDEESSQKKVVVCGESTKPNRSFFVSG